MQTGNEAASTNSVAAVPGSHVPNDPCLVIVDDEPANVTLLKRLIRSLGITNVHGVTDPREAVQRCIDVNADLVLLDLNMPHLDGFEVMDALNAILPDGTFLPVLVLTADSTIETRDRALQAGAKDFLTKPFDHTETLLRVRNLLETRALHTQLRDHNVSLQEELEHRRAQDRRAADEHRQRHERINQTLADRTFTIVFQPIADLRSGPILGMEALARFHGEPQRPPNEWFDEAATVGLETELELAAASTALAQLDQLAPDMFMSVNISPQTVVRAEFAHVLDGLPHERIVLELTEHARVEDYETLLATLDDLHRRGVRIAIDDAGSGYAGLQHILRLRPDIIKLDLELTHGINTDPARRALTTAMISFARELDATIIAEGIETRRELETLRALNVPYGQGYHLARPGSIPLTDTHIAALTTPE